MNCSARRAAAVVAIAAALAAVPTLCAGDVEIPVQIAATPVAVGIRATLEPALLDRIKTQRKATLRSFPVTADTRVDLSVRRLDVFASDARLVVVTTNGEQPLSRPDIT